MFSKYTKYAEDVANKLSDASGRHTKSVVGDINGMIGEIKTMATELGVLDDVESEIGMTFDELSKGVEENYGESYTNGNIWWNGILSTLEGAWGGAITTAVTGNGYATLIGAALGTLGGAVTGIAGTEQHKKENLKLAKSSADAYKRLVVKMTNQAQQKRRQAEIDFAKRS
jgi:hypothetical protein